MMKRFALVLLCVLPFCGVSLAQVVGALSGNVVDGSGAVVAGANVSAVEVSTGFTRKVVSGSEGEFSFVQLLPGKYRVVGSATGFQTVIRNGVSVETGTTVSLQLALVAGGASQQITVTGDTPLLQADASHLATTISGPVILVLPLNGRNFIQLATLAPAATLPPGTLLPRINGGRPRTNEYLFDGISALQPEPGQVAFFPIVDDIAEFTVEANNVSAEFGRFNGGVVNVTTIWGSNDVHGSLYEFLRNEDLNARNYFAPAARKPEYRRNQYGATLGGPVVQDKLFFFGDYQGQKQLIGKTVQSVVPTMAVRQGVFTGVSKIYDPASTVATGNGTYTRTEFANDAITNFNSRVDPVALALLNRFPMPNQSGANNYTRTANDADHQNQFDARVDAARGLSDRAFFRYSYFSDVEQPVTPFPDGSGAVTGSVLGTGNVAGLSNVRGQQFVLGETHIFGPKMLNDVRVGYTRRSNNIVGPRVAGGASSALGIPGIPTNASFNNALPLFTITGYQQLGPSASTFSNYQTGVWEVVDVLARQWKAHSLRMGADLRWYQLNAVSPPNPTGAFGFTVTGTNQQSGSTTTGGNALASFLLGQVSTFSIDLQTSVIRPRDAIQEFFVQDDWKITPRLTANIGARWTLHDPSVEKTNQGAVFNLSTQQLDYLGVNGNPRSARTLHWDNVAPRVGMSYLLTPKTVVRSGFRIVFIDQSGITTPFTTPQFPFIQNVQQATQDNINAAFVLKSGPTVAPIALTPNAGLGQSVYTAHRNLGSGYVQQWNLAVQREVIKDTSIEVAYVGSHIVHVGIPDANINQLTAAQLAVGLTNPGALTGKVTNPYFGQIPSSSPIGTQTVAAAQLLKPYARFQNVAYYRNNTGTSNYNAGTVKIERRLHNGSNLLVSYTHSRLIDDASSVFSSTVLSSPNSSSLIAADAFRPYLERDSSSGDVPNTLTIAGVYAIPMGRGHVMGSNVAERVLLGGWTVNGIYQMPVTVTQATNNNSFAGFSLQRPNVVGPTSLPAAQRSPTRFFTPAFGQPGGSVGAATFGVISTTSAEQRVAQFGVRFSR